jgi:hypothetical protein
MPMIRIRFTLDIGRPGAGGTTTDAQFAHDTILDTLVEHTRIEYPRTWGEAINGYAPGCLACEEFRAAYGDPREPTTEDD